MKVKEGEEKTLREKGREGRHGTGGQGGSSREDAEKAAIGKAVGGSLQDRSLEIGEGKKGKNLRGGGDYPGKENRPDGEVIKRKNEGMVFCFYAGVECPFWTVKQTKDGEKILR